MAATTRTQVGILHGRPVYVEGDLTIEQRRLVDRELERTFNRDYASEAAARVLESAVRVEPYLVPHLLPGFRAIAVDDVRWIEYRAALKAAGAGS